MRYVTSIDYLGEEKFYGVYDTMNKKFVLDLPRYETEEEADAKTAALNCGKLIMFRVSGQ